MYETNMHFYELCLAHGFKQFRFVISDILFLSLTLILNRNYIELITRSKAK